MDEELLSAKEVAKILHVHIETLRRWDNAGRLKAIRLGGKRGIGNRFYRKSEIESLLTRPYGKNNNKNNKV